MRITNFPLVLPNAGYPVLPEADSRGSAYADTARGRDDLIPAAEPVAEERSHKPAQAEILAAMRAAKSTERVVAITRGTDRGDDSRSIAPSRAEKALAAYQDHENVSEREFLREIMGVDLYV